MVDLTDIPYPHTALTEWAALLVYVLILPKRWSKAVTALLMAGAFVLFIVLHGLRYFMFFDWGVPLTFWIPMMLAMFAAMYAVLAAAVATPPAGLIYILVRAIVLAEFMAAFEWQVYVYFVPGRQEVSLVEIHAVALPVFALLTWLAWLAERRHFPHEGAWLAGWGPVVLSLAIGTATFAMSNLSFVAIDTPFSVSGTFEVFYARSLIDLTGLVALYAQREFNRQWHLKRENDVTAGLLRSQHEQYLLARRNADELDRKYHDMKNHLMAARAESDAARREEYLDKLEASIQGYGDQVRTGNAVLDTIIAAKKLSARENQVELSCVVDGALLGHIPVIDLVTIVGNALDNAIEGATRVKDPSQRLARFAVFRHGDFAMIRVENTFDGVLHRDRDRIVTRQRDKERHGFGLRSIIAAAQAHGGAVTVEPDNNWFSLRVLIPLGR
jgi:hypothetical protein